MIPKELIPADLIEKERVKLREFGMNITKFKIGVLQCPKCDALCAIWFYKSGNKAGNEMISCKIEIVDNEKTIERFNVFNKTQNRFEGPWVTKNEYDMQYGSDEEMWSDEGNNEEPTEK